MESEPEFCRDVIETRVKEVFREHLKISRDMPFTQGPHSIEQILGLNNSLSLATIRKSSKFCRLGVSE